MNQFKTNTPAPAPYTQDHGTEKIKIQFEETEQKQGKTIFGKRPPPKFNFPKKSTRLRM